MPDIHPSSFVSEEAVIADDVRVGPQCVIDGPVTLESGVHLVGSVCVQGPCTIGARTILYPFSCVGFPPQDYKFAPGSPTAGVTIGSDCIIREHATVHAASNTERPTRLGNRVFMMVASHVGHDSEICDRVILTNSALIAGHAWIGEGAIFSGNTACHQYLRIGKLAFISGGVCFAMDIPPYMITAERNRLTGVNLVGMRRAGIDRKEIAEVRRAFREVLGPVYSRDEAIEKFKTDFEQTPCIQELIHFFETSKHGIAPGPGRAPRQLTAWLAYRKRAGELNEILASIIPEEFE